MARPVRALEVSESARQELEALYHHSKNRGLSRRAHMCLLKIQGRRNTDIAVIIGCHAVTVGTWLKRYEERGVEGLNIAAGRGRKPILDLVEDGDKVRELVQKERQRLSLVQEELQQHKGRDFAPATLRRFLKGLTQNGSASD